jgi:twitching motility protein PilT
MNYEQEIKDLVDILVKEGGSDLHFSVGHNPSARIATDLVSFIKKPVLEKHDTAGFLQTMIGAEKFAQFLESQEVDFSYEVGAHRLRGNAFFQKGNIGIAMRLLPRISELKELNLPLERILALCEQKSLQSEEGFFLVVGPVGQGKSTT